LFEIESGYCIAGPCSGSSLEVLNLSVQDDILVLSL
jgi:nitrite reductase/ring-hydroxylating ferredoxin subunit